MLANFYINVGIALSFVDTKIIYTYRVVRMWLS